MSTPTAVSTLSPGLLLRCITSLARVPPSHMSQRVPSRVATSWSRVWSRLPAPAADRPTTPHERLPRRRSPLTVWRGVVFTLTENRPAAQKGRTADAMGQSHCDETLGRARDTRTPRSDRRSTQLSRPSVPPLLTSRGRGCACRRRRTPQAAAPRLQPATSSGTRRQLNVRRRPPRARTGC
jgi:hypothetical protein